MLFLLSRKKMEKPVWSLAQNVSHFLVMMPLVLFFSFISHPYFLSIFLRYLILPSSNCIVLRGAENEFGRVETFSAPTHTNSVTLKFVVIPCLCVPSLTFCEVFCLHLAFFLPTPSNSLSPSGFPFLFPLPV